MNKENDVFLVTFVSEEHKETYGFFALAKKDSINMYRILPIFSNVNFVNKKLLYSFRDVEIIILKSLLF